MDGLHTGNYRERLAQTACGYCRRVGAFETFQRGAHTGVRCVCGLEHPINGVMWLRKEENLAKRPPAPETLAETWLRWDECCVGCGRSRAQLDMEGIGREQHHTKPFCDHGHTGPLVPLCAECHELVSFVQRRWRVRDRRRADGQEGV